MKIHGNFVINSWIQFDSLLKIIPRIFPQLIHEYIIMGFDN